MAPPNNTTLIIFAAACVATAVYAVPELAAGTGIVFSRTIKQAPEIKGALVLASGCTAKDAWGSNKCVRA